MPVIWFFYTCHSVESHCLQGVEAYSQNKTVLTEMKNISKWGELNLLLKELSTWNIKVI